MSNIHDRCDVCKKVIPFGAPYVCITYNIENKERDLVRMRDSISVVSSEEIHKMCGKCGNTLHASLMKEAIRSFSAMAHPELN